MPTGPERQQSPVARVASLDGLRGCLVLIVVFLHSFFAVNDNVVYQVFLISWLWSGDTAVDLFFIMSGYVLSLPYISNRSLSWPMFVARRTIRLYPPFAAAVVVSLLLAGRFADWRALFDMLSLSAVGRHGDIDPPLWSLIQEFRMSLVFPLLVFLALRFGATAIAASIGVSVIALPFEWPEPFNYSAAQSAICIVFFITGAYVAKNSSKITDLIGQIPMRYKVLLIPFLLGVFSAVARANVWSTWVLYGSCTVFLACVVASPLITRVLSMEAPQFFGRISYSMYLIHVPILQYVFPLARSVTSPVVALELSWVAVLAGSYALYRAVERPAIGWSKLRFIRLVTVDGRQI